MRLGKKHYIWSRTKAGKRFSRSFWAVLSLFLFVGVGYYMLSIVRPTFAALAVNQARNIAIRTIHQTVSKNVSQKQTEYDSIVALERSADNSITALKSNLSGISKLKSDLNLEILHNISQIDRDRLQIPLGSLLGSDLFAGLGPKISFQIMPYGTAETDIITNFKEAGINQTMLDVSVKVKADVSVLMPTLRKKSTVETTVPVMQTVIVGDVPDSYTHVGREGHAYEDDVLEVLE